MKNNFKLQVISKKSNARVGILTTRRGKLLTPFFMPIATKATVKSITASELKALGSKIVLSNTYHLYLRPGLEILKKANGLHGFMNWSDTILTDSGGYQVFSLKAIRKLTPSGVVFKSSYDGSEHLFTPQKVQEIQKVINSDIRMVLDVCSESSASLAKAQADWELTYLWAKEQKKIYQKSKKDFLLLAIVQGALHQRLRLESAKKLVELDFPGYAIGGLAVGEKPEQMYEVLDYTVPELPVTKPRYLMGVGYPEQIVEAVKRGVDMFDCVIPTREARHGRLYFFTTNKKTLGFKSLFGNLGYYTINATAEKLAKDLSVINEQSKNKELKTLTKSYLRHLFNTNEQLAQRLATLNNLEFYLELMNKIRLAIKQEKL